MEQTSILQFQFFVNLWQGESECLVAHWSCNNTEKDFEGKKIRVSWLKIVTHDSTGVAAIAKINSP